MPLAPPRTLSPSKVSSFTDCALAFRFSAIDRLPEPPSLPATKGTLVHDALQRLLWLAPEDRTLPAALDALTDAHAAMADDPDLTGLELDADGHGALLADAEAMVRRYFTLEDPATVRPIGLELLLEAEVGDTVLRGIIDRLELDADDQLVVTDYKTGRAPNERHERARLEGVQLYALLCERVLGRRPVRVQLLYLSEPAVVISCVTSDNGVQASERKVGAIWQAVQRACANDSFRPQPSRLCDYCAYTAYCPAFGGDPALAREIAGQQVLLTASA